MISILLPTFNASEFLAETIDTIIKQTHKDWELIVVDDGSNDGTLELLDYFKKDKRIKCFVNSKRE